MIDWSLTVFFLGGRETQIYSRENSSIFAREMESDQWKNGKTPSKVRVKIIFFSWNLRQIARVTIKFNSREKYRKLHPWKGTNAREQLERKFVNFSGNTYWKLGIWDNVVQ